MLPKNFKISSFLSPIVFEIGDKTFVTPGWHEVPNGTTREEVVKRWTKILPKETEEKPTYKIYELVDSSKGDKQYAVTFDGLWWNCPCPGYQYRGNCRHVKEIKAKHNIQTK